MSDAAIMAIAASIAPTIAAIGSLVVAWRTSKAVKTESHRALEHRAAETIVASKTAAKLDEAIAKTETLAIAVNGEMAKRVAAEVAAAQAQGELKGQAVERAQTPPTIIVQAVKKEEGA